MKENSKTIIIAEIGVNHNASWDLAVEMIRAAATAGADIIKFQTAIPELVQTKNAPMAQYQIANTGIEESQMEMSRKFHFTHDIFPKLKDCVENHGKQFMSTAFDLRSLEMLANLGEKLFKIPSGEITNLPYLRAIAGYADQVFISTGMATLEEVKSAVDALLAAGLKNNQITVLQCNTEYPTPFEDVNLNAMVEMGKELKLNYGYSDHTQGIEASLAAVALGARVIEKHFTTDCSLPGPDQLASLEPGEFAQMVKGIRNIEKAMGSAFKSPTPSELKNRVIARRSIFTACQIKAGETITSDKLVILRPEIGLSPMMIDDIIGSVASRDLDEQCPISLSDIKQ